MDKICPAVAIEVSANVRSIVSQKIIASCFVNTLKVSVSTCNPYEIIRRRYKVNEVGFAISVEITGEVFVVVASDIVVFRDVLFKDVKGPISS